MAQLDARSVAAVGLVVVGFALLVGPATGSHHYKKVDEVFLRQQLRATLDGTKVECGKAPLFPKNNAKSAYQCRGRQSDSSDYNSADSDNVYQIEDEKEESYLGNEKKGRLSNGWLARRGEFPSFVDLHVRKEGMNISLDCNGVWLGGQWVLSAGHCVGKRRRVKKIVLHGGFANMTNEITKKHTRRATLACVHPDFGLRPDKGGAKRDIMFIKLNKPFEVDDYMQPACVGHLKPRLPNSYCFIMGTGIITPDESIDSGRLVANTAKEGCKDKKQEKASNEFQVSCWTQDNDKYPGTLCVGDSGAPLICIENCNGKTRQWVSAIHVFGGPKSSCTIGNRTFMEFTDLSYLGREADNFFKYCTRMSDNVIGRIHWTELAQDK